MADTFLEALLDHFVGLQPTVNAALVAAGLDELVDWYSGEPRPLRTNSTPYAWVMWDPDGGDGKLSELAVVTHDVAVRVVLVLAGSDEEDLTRQIAGYLPRLMAAIESAPGAFDVVALGWDLIGAEEGPVALLALRFQVQFDREIGVAS